MLITDSVLGTDKLDLDLLFGMATQVPAGLQALVAEERVHAGLVLV